MEVAAVLGAIGSVVGTAVSFMGSQAATKASKRAEMLRKKQMNMEATRAKRGEIRKAMITRSQIASQAQGQGAADTSGSMGVQGSIQTAQAVNTRAIANAAQIGTQIFDQNAKIAQAQGQQNLGQGITSMFNTFLT